MPIPIVLALGAAQGLFQGISAISQKRKANKLKASTFEPPALTEEANIARTQANASRYAGQDIDEENLRQSGADSVSNAERAATSSGQLLNVGSKISKQTDRGFRNIARQGEAFRQNALDKYRGVLRSKAQNQLNNQNQFQAAKSALIGSSNQNAYNALSSVLGGAAISDFNKTGKSNQFVQSNPFADTFSGSGFNPNMFSSYKWNPNAFSANYSN